MNFSPWVFIRSNNDLFCIVRVTEYRTEYASIDGNRLRFVTKAEANAHAERLNGDKQ